jgi:hypothetical protein
MPQARFTSIIVALVVTASLARASVPGDVLVDVIDPAQPAGGQVVLISTNAHATHRPDAFSPAVRVSVEQEGDTREAFVFPNATRADAIFARLPDALRPGPAWLIVELADGVAGEPFPFEVGPGAAAPAIWAVYPYASFTGESEPAAPVAHTRAGDRLVLFGAGMDTTGVTVVLRHSGGTDEVAPTFAHTSTSVGVAPVFDVPPDLPAGSVSVSARVRVCDDLEACRAATASGESAPIELVVD